MFIRAVYDYRESVLSKWSDKENADNLEFYAVVRSSDLDVQTAM